jgi:hypothetical protein
LVGLTVLSVSSLCLLEGGKKKKHGLKYTHTYPPVLIPGGCAQFSSVEFQQKCVGGWAFLFVHRNKKKNWNDWMKFQEREYMTWLEGKH